MMNEIKKNKALSDKWSSRFLEMAKQVSLWSKDPSTKVGAVIATKECKVLGLGYNGILAKVKSDIEDSILSNRDSKLKYTIHAEVNAIMNCNREIKESDDAVLFVTQSMCSECAKFIALTNIKHVIYLGSNESFNLRWGHDDAVEILESCGIKVEVRMTNRQKISKAIKELSPSTFIG